MRKLYKKKYSISFGDYTYNIVEIRGLYMLLVSSNKRKYHRSLYYLPSFSLFCTTMSKSEMKECYPVMKKNLFIFEYLIEDMISDKIPRKVRRFNNRDNKSYFRIYVSGPITGIGDHMSNFESAVSYLKMMHPTAEIINPAEILDSMGKDANLTHNDYMKIALELLKLCSHIFLMEGWMYSKGCREEYALANKLGIRKIVKKDR